jgi:ribosomal protein S18 acetylase RimI-like enzyme
MSAEQAAPGSQFTIEQATWRDLNELRKLEKVCFPQDAWPLWDMIGILTLPKVMRLKAVVEEKMAGFVGVDVRPSRNMAWIAIIGVLPEYRGKGIGKALMQSCEGRLHVARLRLSVRASNQPAIQMYEELGYRRVGVWPGYYQKDREDALVYEKWLSP